MSNRTTLRRPAHSLLVACLTLSLTTSGCGLGDQVDKIVNAGNAAVQQAGDSLDIAISQLQGESANWQQVLANLQSQLTKDARELIGNDVQNLITRTINHAGIEFRCNGDFINQRVSEALIAIKAKLMKQPVPALEPRFCSAIPEAVDMQLVPATVNKVAFYGFNFDNNAGFRLELEDLNGAKRDVTRAVSIPTAYAMTLAIGPSGAILNNQSTRLLLYWKDKLVSTVSVIQPQPVVKICQSSVAATPMQEVGPLIPPKVNGDKEFGGNGPTIWSSANITNTPVDVTLRLHFRAKETKSDWTEVAGSMNATIYRAPAGKRIDRIIGPTHSSFGPIVQPDDDHWALKVFELGAGGLLKNVQITGDQGGDDVGRTGLTKVIVNPIQVALVETGDCVSPLALNNILGTRFVSEGLKRSVTPRVSSEMNRIERITGRVVNR